MNAAPDPASAARAAVDAQELPAIARFVGAFGVTRDPTGLPEVVDVTTLEAGAALVAFRAADARLHLVVATEPTGTGHRAVDAAPAPYVRVALRIRSRSHDPDAITAQLGIAPSRQAHAGRTLLGSDPVVRDDHLWLRDVLPLATAAVETKLHHLLDMLGPRRFALADLLRGASDAAVVVAYHADADAMEGLRLDPDLLRRAAELGIPLEIDLYAERPGGPPH